MVELWTVPDQEHKDNIIYNWNYLLFHDDWVPTWLRGKPDARSITDEFCCISKVVLPMITGKCNQFPAWVQVCTECNYLIQRLHDVTSHDGGRMGISCSSDKWHFTWWVTVWEHTVMWQGVTWVYVLMCCRPSTRHFISYMWQLPQVMWHEARQGKKVSQEWGQCGITGFDLPFIYSHFILLSIHLLQRRYSRFTLAQGESDPLDLLHMW